MLIEAKTLHKSSETQLNLSLQVDDVYSPEFAHNVVLTGSPEELDHEWSTLISWNFSAVYTSDATDLPAGPYFLHGSEIHQAWRLYPDYLDALIFGVLPENVLQPQRSLPCPTP